jgi:SLA1 Homology Domain 1 (SHD1) protein
MPADAAADVDPAADGDDEPGSEVMEEPSEDTDDELPLDDALAPPDDKSDDVNAPPAPEESADETLPEPSASSKISRPESAAAASAATNRPAAADAMRLWTDNTGRHQVRARLVTVFDGKARLLKENGHFTTVPFARLSAADLAFVQRQTPTVASSNAEQKAGPRAGIGF